MAVSCVRDSWTHTFTHLRCATALQPCNGCLNKCPIVIYMPARHWHAVVPLQCMSSKTLCMLRIASKTDDFLWHAKYSYSGTATNKPLMAWLDEYTFPRESRHQDLALARTEYSKLVQRLLSNGTTTSLYFASLHLEPAQLLAELLHQVCTASSVSCSPLPCVRITV